MDMERSLLDTLGWDRERLFRFVKSITLTLIQYSFKDGSLLRCVGFAVGGRPTDAFKVSEYMMSRLLGEK